MNQVEPQLIFNHQTKDEKIRVWQQDNRRWLDFDDGLIQSEILLNKPDRLPLILNRAMLAGMIFSEQPERVLLAGTGGGATARYFAHRFPDVIGDAVEQSDTIVEAAKNYFDFPLDGNWQIIKADILNYVRDCQKKYDLIVVDIAEDRKTPEWLVKSDFLVQCRAILTETGHIAINLLQEDADSFSHDLSSIRNIFDGMTICLSLPEHRNIITMAYNRQPLFQVENMVVNLASLDKLWEIEFSAFYRQMLRDNPEDSGII